MNRPILRLAALLLVSVLAGCAYGTKHSYQSAQVELASRGSGSVTVGVWDRRPYVLDGDKPATYTGLQRNGYAIPFNVNTASGRPLAQDMGDTLTQSLNAAGYSALSIELQPQDSLAGTRGRLLRGSPRRAVLLTLAEWKSETLKNTDLYYDLRMYVYDSRGKLLGSRWLKGMDAMDGSFFRAKQKAAHDVPEAFRQKLETLLDSPEIAAALK